MPEASVIIPARDARATIGRTLKALAAQDVDVDFEVIVVDDGSSDGTAATARGSGAAVTVLEQEAEGPAAARNRGATAARGRVLAFLDADCFPTVGWLAAGLRTLGEVELVQGRVLPDPGADLGPFDRSLWLVRETGLYEAANLFVTREAFERAGGFEEWLRPDTGKAIAEDVWFGWRARRAGARTAFAPEALAHHAVFPRGPLEYIAERRRLRYFPAMAAKVPELREAFLYRRWFLNRRAAALDLGVAGALAALALRSRLPLLAAAPYAAAMAPHGRAWGPGVLAYYVAADVVGLASLAAGSARYRALVI